MSLQGSIETFAVADVLRLLAATSKSGRLHVQGTTRAGTVWVESARVLAAESPSTPIVTGPVDILFQLLRFERGSFRFELDKYPPEPGEPLEIELALTEAEAMVVEWRELELRIPSQECWVQLKPALAGDSVALTAPEWLTLVAIAGGRSVADIGQVLVSGELQTARALARLLELELIDILNRPAASAGRENGSENGALREAPSFGPLSLEDGGTAHGAQTQPAGQPTPLAAAGNSPAAATAGSWPDNNGLSGLAPPPPVPPTPLTPPPSWAPAPPAVAGWASPEYPTLAPAPEAAPPGSGSFPAPSRPEAGLISGGQERSAFPTPPETDLDHGAAARDTASAITPSTTVFNYPAVEEGHGPDPYSYPPPAAPGPAESALSGPSSNVSPPTVAAGGWSPSGQDQPADGGANGYPAVAPPMPPAFGSSIPGGSAAWNPGSATPPAEAPAADNGWIGSLTDAIERADDAGDGPNQPSGEERSANGNGLTGGNFSGGGTASGGPSAPSRIPPMPPAPRVTLGGASWGNSPVPPPPAPPAPAGGWASSASLFEGGTPERLAPPPPPPPPLMAAGSALTQGMHPGMVDVATPPQPEAGQYGNSTDDADDIDRQLFNLSPRAREAVKQSSGLYDARERG